MINDVKEISNSVIDNKNNEIATNLRRIKVIKEAIYDKIDNDKRLELLRLVRDEKRTLKEASEILKINYSTAKTIIRVYRKEKRIFKKSALKNIDYMPEAQLFPQDNYSLHHQNQIQFQKSESQSKVEQNLIFKTNPNTITGTSRNNIKDSTENYILFKRKLSREIHSYSQILNSVHNDVINNKRILNNILNLSLVLSQR